MNENKLDRLEVVIPTYHSPILTSILLRSFEKFKPDDMELIYHVVENSSDTSYKQDILQISENIIWYNNPEADSRYETVDNKPSWANHSALEYVRDKIETPYTLLCHNDCVVASTKFFDEFKDIANKGYKLIGTSWFPSNGALHVAGLLVETEIFKKVGTKPNFDEGLDVGDILTLYCLENELPMFCFNNTLNKPEITSFCNEPWKFLAPDCGVDRTFDSKHEEVINVHLSRGAEKNIGRYIKLGKLNIFGWSEICNRIILGGEDARTVLEEGNA